jgi:hypothetical protein
MLTNKINDLDIKNAAINFINNMFDLIRKESIDDDNKYQLEMAHYLHYID